MRPQFAFYRKAWDESLAELHKQWGGDFNPGANIIPPTGEVIFKYASLSTDIREHKVYLYATMQYDAAYNHIYVYGKWKSELILTLESLHDRFLKLIGLEYEITLAGNEANIIMFNKKYLIKGEPKEFVSGFLSDYKNQDIIGNLGDFCILSLKDNVARLEYELSSEEIVKSDLLSERINYLIDFLLALQKAESEVKS